MPSEQEDELHRIRRALGLRRPVRLAVHPEITAPMCVGLLRPVILLPTEENCPMTPGQRRASLAHELAHLRHFDDWVGLLAELWRRVSWFYPPIHWTLGRLYLERERGATRSPRDIWRAPSATPAGCSTWPRSGSGRRSSSRRCWGARTWRPGSAASSMAGRGPLDPMTRLRRGILVVLAVSLLAAAGSVRLVGFAARAGEAESPDAPLPEITREALAERIVESRKRYAAGRIEVEFEEERGPIPSFPTAKPRREHHVPRSVPVCQRRPPVAR